MIVNCANFPGAGGSAVTETAVSYTYDGVLSDDGVYGTNYSGVKCFARVSTTTNLKLTGGHICVYKSEWQSVDVSITDEMVTSAGTAKKVETTVSLDGVDTLVTLAIIASSGCTVSGAQIGWEDTVTLPSAGVYVFTQKAGLGGNYWVSKFDAVLVTGGGGDNSSGDSGTVSAATLEAGIFSRGICIGDSITEGVLNVTADDYDDATIAERNQKCLPVIKNGQIVLKQYSYPRQFTRLTGIPVYNAGIAGIRSHEWLTAIAESWDTANGGYWGTWRDEADGWAWNSLNSHTLDLSGYDFAIIHLGINDILMMGDSDDISTVIAAYATAVNGIITALKTANAGIKVFLCTIIPAYSKNNGTNWDMLNVKISEIAEATDGAYLIDLAGESKCEAGTAYTNGHLTALGYRQMAAEIAQGMAKAIRESPADFAAIQFIGDYANKPNDAGYLTLETLPKYDGGVE